MNNVLPPVKSPSTFRGIKNNQTIQHFQNDHKHEGNNLASTQLIYQVQIFMSLVFEQQPLWEGLVILSSWLN